LAKSINYFNQAIAKDSNYALAYAGLADAYNSLSWYDWIPAEDGIQKCREFAEKAISLDDKLAEGHAALGDCASDFLWDWDLAEKEFKQAIKLNPNFALAYKYYADYLDILGKNKEARIMIDKANELIPQSVPIRQSSAHCYYNEGKFEKALDEIDRVKELQPNSSWVNWLNFKIYFNQGKDSLAFQELKNYLRPENQESNDYLKVNQIFAESGMHGISRWLIEYISKKNNPRNDYETLAFHIFLDEESIAFEKLNKIYNSDSRFILSWITSDYDLKTIRNDSRFTALLEKMNLADK
jgi:tetratricopeptide (TPR) repeat protein